MTTARFYATATLLPNGLVLVAGGVGSSGVLSTAELYNPATNKWLATGAISHGEKGLSAILLPNGEVLVFGGVDSSHQPVASAELYNPANGQWSPAATPLIAQSGASVALLPNGLVLVAGGEDINGNALSSAELYDPFSNAAFSSRQPEHRELQWQRRGATQRPGPGGGGFGSSGVVSSGSCMAVPP